MASPQAKRRRLDEAAKTLHKPFKSPFRTPLRQTIGSSDPPSSDPPDLIATPHIIPHLTPTTKSRLPVLKKPTSSKPSLAREIMQLRSEIQMLSQALTLATSTRDDDLIVLIDRWRTASRAAAEELFASTKDRVNRMGGVGAWREREREQREWRRKGEMEELEAERERLRERQSGNEGEEEDGHLYDGDGDGEEALEVDGVTNENEEMFKCADDDSFTMDMMLKTLNIDLKLIGYNKEAQRWDG